MIKTDTEYIFEKYLLNDASIYLGPVKQRNVNKMKTVLINTDNRCNLY